MSKQADALTVEEGAALSEDLGLCTAFHSRIPCGTTAVIEGVRGCVHEHIKVVRHCSRHRSIAEAGRLACIPCLDAGHWCRAQVTYR